MPVSLPTRLPKLPKRENSVVPRSQAERLWLIGGGLVAFVLLLIGYFFFISPQRSDTSRVNAQVAEAQAGNQRLEARIAALRLQSRNAAKYRAELTRAQLALPSTSGMSDFLRSLQSLGNTTLTNVTSLTVGTPTAVASPVAATSTPAPGAPSTTSAAPSTTSPPAGTPAAAAGSQLYSLTITATVTGSPSGLDKFLEQLQSVQPRAVLISQLNETTGQAPGTGAIPGAAVGSSGTSLQLTLQVFVAASPSGQSAPSPTPAH